MDVKIKFPSSLKNSRDLETPSFGWVLGAAALGSALGVEERHPVGGDVYTLLLFAENWKCIKVIKLQIQFVVLIFNKYSLPSSGTLWTLHTS